MDPKQNQPTGERMAREAPPEPTPNQTPEEPTKHSKAPTRKVASFTAGGALGGHVAVIAAYHLPTLPPEVIGAYTALLVLLVGGLVAYLVPPERT